MPSCWASPYARGSVGPRPHLWLEELILFVVAVKSARSLGFWYVEVFNSGCGDLFHRGDVLQRLREAAESDEECFFLN